VADVLGEALVMVKLVTTEALEQLDAFTLDARDMEIVVPVVMDTAPAVDELEALRTLGEDAAPVITPIMDTVPAVDELEALRTLGEAASPVITPMVDVVPARADLEGLRTFASAAPPVITPMVDTAPARAEVEGLTADTRAFGAESMAAGAESKGAFAGAVSAAKPLLAILGVVAGFEAIKHIADDTKEFQTRLVDLETGAGESARNLGLVSAGLKEMSSEVGVSAINLEKGLYYIESDGYHGAEGLTVLKAAAEGARTGLADMETVSKSVLTAMRAYEIPVSQATETTSALVEAVAHAGVRMSDFVTGLQTVTPVAAALKVPLDQVLGALATITSVTHNAAVAGTGIRYLLGALASPTLRVADGLDTIHLSVEQVQQSLGQQGLMATLQMIEDALGHTFPGSSYATQAALDALSKGIGGVSAEQLQTIADTKGLSAALDIVSEKLGKKVPSDSALAIGTLEKITGGVRGATAAFELTGPHLQEWAKNTQDIAEKSSEAGTNVAGWSAMTQTLGVQVDRTKARISSWGLSIGQDLLPALTRASVFLNDDLLPGLGDVAHVTGDVLTAAWRGAAGVADSVLGPALRTLGTTAKTAMKDARTGSDLFMAGVHQQLGATGIPGWEDALVRLGTVVHDDVLPKVGGIGSALTHQFSGIGGKIAAATSDATTGSEHVITGIINGLDHGFQTGDWSKLGKEVAKGIGTALNAISSEGASLTNDLIHLLGRINWEKLAYFVGHGLAVAIEDSAVLAEEFTKAFGKLAEKIDWVGIGIDIGKEIPSMAVGLLAGIAHLNIGGLFRDSWKHLPDIIIGLLSLALAPERMIGAIGEALSHVPLAGRLLQWGFEGLTGFAKGFARLLSAPFRAIGRGILEGLGRELPDLSEVFGRWVTSAGAAITHEVEGTGEYIARGFEQIGRDIGHRALDPIVSGIEAGASELKSVGRWIVTGIVDGVEALPDLLLQGAKWLGKSFIDAVKGVFGIHSPSTVMTGIGEDVIRGFVFGILEMTGVADAFDSVYHYVKTWSSDAGTWLKDEGGWLIHGLAEGFDGGEHYVSASLGTAYRDIENWASGAGNWLWIAGSDLIHGLSRGADSADHFVTWSLGTVYHDIVNWGSGAGNWLWHAGSDLIGGLTSGMESGAASVWHTITNIGSSIIHGVKEFFGIHSPSTVMAGLGANIVAGLVLGIVNSSTGMGGILDKVFSGILADPWTWIGDHLSDLGNMLDKVPGLASKLVMNLPELAVKLGGKALGGLESILGLGGGGTSALAKTIDASLSLNHLPPSWEPFMATLVTKESGGRATAVNPTVVDGQHATGIAQMLPSTFARWELPGLTDIYDPIDNLVASERYIQSDYGAPWNIPGLLHGTYVGYDEGGLLPPGKHLTVNATGKPERIMTAGQSAQFDQLIAALSGMGSGGAAPIYLKVQIGDRDITDIASAAVSSSGKSTARNVNYGIKVR
jgi:TP901 family phage tail tape measure protein